MEIRKRLLSPREVEVLSYVSNGFGYKEISLELKISERTVQTHAERIKIKLDAKNITNAVKIAINKELI